jgi:outer membrane protein, multidrug efflux system
VSLPQSSASQANSAIKSIHLLPAEKRAGSLTWVMAALLLVALSGCKVGPNYHRPSVPAAPQWKEEPPWRTATPQDSIPKGAWWTIFGDPELNQYETQAVAASPTIDIARYQLEQARASARISTSGLYPQANVSPTAQRQLLAGNRPLSGSIVPLKPITQNDFILPFNTSWELDLFGGVRRGIESSNALYQASAAALENTRLVVTSEVAADYFSLRELDAEIAVVNSAVDYQEKGLRLVQNRHDGGLASGLDVAQQQTLLESTRTQATLLTQQRAQFEHAIARLMGTPASSFTVPVKPLELKAPVIPTGVPSDILERRPDVAIAERQMASQNAQIGVAKAAFYPSIGLTGSGGVNSQVLSDILKARSAFWAIGASLTQPLINGGRLSAQLDFAKSGYGASVASYRQTVLTAFQEVEDALIGLSVLSQAATTQQKAVEAADRALKIANDRYVGGLVTYLDVITAQETLLDNQRLATQLLGQQLVTSVTLIKALGGGWDATALQPIHVDPTWKQAIQP